MFEGDKEQVEKAMLRLSVDEIFPTCVLRLSESRLIIFVERKRGLIALNIDIEPPGFGKERQGTIMRKFFENWSRF